MSGRTGSHMTCTLEGGGSARGELFLALGRPHWLRPPCPKGCDAQKAFLILNPIPQEAYVAEQDKIRLVGELVTVIGAAIMLLLEVSAGGARARLSIR